ncbi:MAG TPA: hypothetical protein VFU46_02380 [Gemmatimonadales bacterium]|nr:hypothetical protein [Gemmatimonadales bacterium]
MLAYLFWHWRGPHVDAAPYEQAQRRFHAALREAPPPGFLRSRTAALAGAPWAGGGGEAYEDWYLLEDSAALDALNDAAVTASRRAPHDAAAALAGGGTGGVYHLRLGAPVREPRFAWWFGKPAGTSYTALDELLRPVVERGAALWCRHMVLGPAPEFCVQAAAPVALPVGLGELEVALRPVWS